MCIRDRCIENIDIGGPSLIRGAAKNFESCAVLTSTDQYKDFIDEAESNKNLISLKTRKELAKSAFRKTAYYDGLIANWFMQNDELLETTHSSIPLKRISKLRYGENPHQKAAIYSFGKNVISKISGKDLSYLSLIHI